VSVGIGSCVCCVCIRLSILIAIACWLLSFVLSLSLSTPHARTHAPTDARQQMVVVKIVQPQLPTFATATAAGGPPTVEVIGGELRIGEEVSEMQELLKTWFYTCYCIGTVVFGFIYYVLGLWLGWIWRKDRRRFHREEDETWGLDLQDDGADFDDIHFGDSEHASGDREGTDAGGERERVGTSSDLNDVREHNGGDAAGTSDEIPIDDHLDDEEPTIPTERDQTAHENAARRMRSVEIQEEGDDGYSSSSWEDLYYPVADFGVALPVNAITGDASTLGQHVVEAVNIRANSGTLRQQGATMDSSTTAVQQQSRQEREYFECGSSARPVRLMTDDEVIDVLSQEDTNASNSEHCPQQRHPFFFFLGW